MNGLNSATARALAVLDRVTQSDRPVALTEIADTLGLPKATSHRIARTLESEGMLVREPGGKRYSAGPRLSALSINALTHGNASAGRHATLQKLVNEIGETCNFMARDGAELVYLDRVEATWPLRIHLKVGSRVPLHCIASGKLFLALMPAAQRRRLLSTLPMKRYTPNTLSDPRELDAALARIRKERIGTDNEEFLEGMVAVAVPVFDAARRICATIAVHGPTARLTLDTAMSHAGRLRAAAQQLSAERKRK